ncbi:MAG TPA: 2-phospho-L-lactate transferase [Acidimicrobiales bacterium]|nr:2-phospho-L-lactate transferase [Acidimicrobiales bacterium]
MIAAIAGGVGAARMLAALSLVVDPTTLTAVVNTGDDTVLHGLHVSPDLDTVTYTLAGQVNPETGWGRVGETWSAMAELRAYGGDRLAWFNLGDLDLGTHLYRTARLAEGAPLAEVTAEITARWGLPQRLLPMSDQRVETRVTVDDGGQVAEVGFQEYFVRLRHDLPVRALRLAGVEAAKAAPGVLTALEQADGIVLCPSNPVLSIGPVLATGGIGDAVARRRDRTVAVSPIVGGRALKGPADRVMADLGHAPTVVGVARLWAPYAATLVVDPADAHLAAAVEAEGVRCVVTPSVMHDEAASRHLATAVLDALASPAGR